MSAVWVSNLYFQPIIYCSLELYHRMFINKWKRLVACPKISKNGCMINKWYEGKLFLIRGWDKVVRDWRIALKWAVKFSKNWHLCIQPFLLQQCLSSSFSRYSNLLPFQDLSELDSLASEFQDYQNFTTSL